MYELYMHLHVTLGIAFCGSISLCVIENFVIGANEEAQVEYDSFVSVWSVRFCADNMKQEDRGVNIPLFLRYVPSLLLREFFYRCAIVAVDVFSSTLFFFFFLL